MRRLIDFVRLSRPHFLLGGFLMFALGVEFGSPIEPSAYVLGQVVVSAAQLTAHYVNEHFDQDADRLVVNRTPFSGGSGVLVEWGPESQVALRAAVVTSLIAIVGSVLLLPMSPAAAALGVIALAVSWAYSAPPIRLLGSGWGEIITSIVVTVVVPLVGLTLTSVPLDWAVGSVLAVLLATHFAMMVVFELPDLETDRLAGKRVLAVRLGEKRSVRLIYLMLAVSFVGYLLLPVRAVELPTWNVVALMAAAGFLSWLLSRRRYKAATTVAVLVFVVVAIGALTAF